jgi:hypothetical protein
VPCFCLWLFICTYLLSYDAQDIWVIIILISVDTYCFACAVHRPVPVTLCAVLLRLAGLHSFRVLSPVMVYCLVASSALVLLDTCSDVLSPLPCSWGGGDTGTWPSRLGESQKIETITGLRPKNGCTGDAQEELKITVPTSRQRGRPT